MSKSKTGLFPKIENPLWLKFDKYPNNSNKKLFVKYFNCFVHSNYSDLEVLFYCIRKGLKYEHFDGHNNFDYIKHCLTNTNVRKLKKKEKKILMNDKKKFREMSDKIIEQCTNEKNAYGANWKLIDCFMNKVIERAKEHAKLSEI
jgi:hypothetical protein